ncbi:hypothetical protein CPB84DRAFT_1537242 [Gymnopilus junonius]|uniref:Uncharacterized protein n=1 Tax=Gymnopilus junonius TaxID=109634 RepID=A0A9P5NHJ3_GYMJU|nr:hypothetical protein CPB84DRAFT_1537242 [Gymnopilus junonius]
MRGTVVRITKSEGVEIPGRTEDLNLLVHLGMNGEEGRNVEDLNMLTVGSRFPDTDYGSHTPEIRRLSETADNLIWDLLQPHYRRRIIRSPPHLQELCSKRSQRLHLFRQPPSCIRCCSFGVLFFRFALSHRGCREHAGHCDWPFEAVGGGESP